MATSRKPQDNKEETAEGKNLTYRQARYVRQSKLSDILAGELSGGASLREGIKKTISLRTKAEMTGLREKFDPLNIAKVLTGSVGTVLLGRATGRSKSDINYFTGRAKLIRNLDSFFNIGKDPAQTKQVGGTIGNTKAINETLVRMYSFLKKMHLTDIKRKNKQDNFFEENELERQQRHKSLIGSLEKLIERINDLSDLVGQQQSAQEEQSGTGIPGIPDSVERNRPGRTSPPRAPVPGAPGGPGVPTEPSKPPTPGAPTGEGPGKPGVPGTGTGAAKEAAKALLQEALRKSKDPRTIGTILAILAAIETFNVLSNQTEEGGQRTAEGVAGAEGSTIPRTMTEVTRNVDGIERKRLNILANRPAEEKSVLGIFGGDVEKQNDYLKRLGWDEKTGTTRAERAAGVIGVDDNGNNIQSNQPLIAPEIMRQIMTPGAPGTPGQPGQPGRTGASVPGAPGAVERTNRTLTETLDSNAPSVTDSVIVKPPAPAVPAAKPMPQSMNQEPTNSTLILNRLVKENVESNLPTATAQNINKVVNNITQNTTKNTQNIKTDLKTVSVRNDEPTFMRLIFNNTRVV